MLDLRKFIVQNFGEAEVRTFGRYTPLYISYRFRPMVTCQSCQKTSTLDSRFCRACGAELEPTALNDARHVFDELVASGRKLLEEGRADEANMVAEEAIQQDPSSADAYTLLGDSKERLGDLAGAIDAYETVVELHPDSPLDRIKLAHIRKLLSNEAQLAPVSRGVNPIVAGGIAALAAACFGIGYIMIKGSPVAPATAQTDVPKNEPVRVNWGDAANSTGSNPQAAATRPASPGSEATAGRQTPEIPTQPVGGTPRATSSLPMADGNGQIRPLSPGPIEGSVRISPESGKAASSPPPANSVDPDPAPSNATRSGATTTNSNRTARPRNSVVDIRPSAGQADTLGGSSVVDRSGPSAALANARRAFLAGDYSQAADAYEKALSLGADPGTSNQRLAQCYERLGRKSEALQAYRRALDAFQSSNTAQAQTAAEACRQAIKVLGG